MAFCDKRYMKNDLKIGVRNPVYSLMEAARCFSTYESALHHGPKA